MPHRLLPTLCLSAMLHFTVRVYGMEQMLAAEGPISPNFCNSSEILEEAGLIKSTLGQFLGYSCSEEFYHCRWQSDGFRTYRKKCKPGLVYDVLGTQNCNYDYNVKSCGVQSGGPVQCNGTDFHCVLSDQCVPMSSRCDGHYDCSMEEDEQNCPLCTSGEFACKASEQCISLDRRCNGMIECDDGTDERDCDICGHGLFHCGKSNECIPMDERCDGRRQCPHGEDEMLCKKPEAEKKFTCQSRDYEVPISQVCDGLPNCPDGSDEIYCEIPGAQKPQPSITFSSNLKPNQPQPSQPNLPPPSPETDETEEDYDYEQIKSENGQAEFPMISLGPLPVTTTTIVPPATTRPVKKLTLVQASLVNKPAFSRPRPKVDSNTANRLTSGPRNLKATQYTTKTTKRPTAFETVKSVSRENSFAKNSSLNALVQPPRSPDLPQPKEEKVFIMQVTVPPPVKSVNEVHTSSSGTVTRAMSIDRKRGRPNNNILEQITSQINGGMSPELLAKIETIINSEMRGSENTRRRSANAK